MRHAIIFTFFLAIMGCAYFYVSLISSEMPDETVVAEAPRTSDAPSNSRAASERVTALRKPKKHWVPIRVSYVGNSNPTVTLCVLDFETYHKDPSQYPMFRDLVKLSKCNARSKDVTMDQLEKTVESGDPIRPNGFVFHESRCGSTLVANMLGSDPKHLVFAESAPVADVALRAPPEHKTRHLRIIMGAMGNAPAGVADHLFFKFQSVLTFHISDITAAFPDVPWIFVYRAPVEVIMSHMKRPDSAPCMRSRHSPPQIAIDVFKMSKYDLGRLPKEEYCAVHLASLCLSALKVATESAANGAGKGKGIPVEYDGLVDMMVTEIAPNHFGLTMTDVRTKAMRKITEMYSKDRGRVGKFTADSEKKRNSASEAVNTAAKKRLEPVFLQLRELSSKQRKLIEQ
jgi:hypothetical protein